MSIEDFIENQYIFIEIRQYYRLVFDYGSKMFDKVCKIIGTGIGETIQIPDPETFKKV